jgi:hypothetical protein
MGLVQDANSGKAGRVAAVAQRATNLKIGFKLFVTVHDWLNEAGFLVAWLMRRIFERLPMAVSNSTLMKLDARVHALPDSSSFARGLRCKSSSLHLAQNGHRLFITNDVKTRPPVFSLAVSVIEDFSVAWPDSF